MHICRLDILEGELSAVTRVRGSDRLQTAYRLEKQVDLTRDTRYNMVQIRIQFVSK